MKWLDPASLAWLALLPVLVAFYLMKLRRKQAPVSALFLWQAAAREARVDSFFQRLKANLLLFLQILALLALGVGLARPYMVVPGRVSDQVAIVMDVSASMGAEGRFEAARKRALTLVNQAPRNTEITLAAMGRETRVIVPFTTDKEQVRRALRGLAPLDVEEGPEGARSLLTSILTSRKNAEGFVLSDHPPRWEMPPRVSYLAHGEVGNNLAISAFQIAPGPTPADPYQAFAAVTSYSDRPFTVPVVLYRHRREIYRRDLTLPAGARRTLVLPVPVSGEPDFELRIEHADALLADDAAWAVAPRQSPVRALVVGSGMRFAVKALLSLPGVEAFTVGDGPWDLTLWTEPPPARLGPGVHLVLEPSGAPVKGPFALAARPDPLVRDLPLDRVWVQQVFPLKVGPKARVLATAGPHPAIVVEDKVVRLGFDLYESDFPLSPAFPIFISRVVDQLVRGLVTAVPVEVAPGTALVLRTENAVRVVTPVGARLELEPVGGEAVLADTARSGLYRVEIGEDDFYVAASLRSSVESDLRVAPGEDRLSAVAETGLKGEATSQSLVEEYWWQLVLAALIVLLGEWFLYHRRPS